MECKTFLKRKTENFFAGRAKFGEGGTAVEWQSVEGEGGVTVRLREEGGRVSFRCRRAADNRGIYKVWLRGGGGELLLGTLAPEGDGLTLTKTLAIAQLQRCGCWPVRGAVCRLSWMFPAGQQGNWRWEEHPEKLVDAETARVGEWSPMLLHRDEDGIELAVPLSRKHPLSLSALICLARAGKIGGELCLIWRFDRMGHPLFPQPDQSSGQHRT